MTRPNQPPTPPAHTGPCLSMPVYPGGGHFPPVKGPESTEPPPPPAPPGALDEGLLQGLPDDVKARLPRRRSKK